MKLYVGNLNYRINESDLKKRFETIGAVSSSKIILDKTNGRSKGFGFITMENENDGNRAIKELNGQNMEDRRISVSEARPTNY